MTTTANRTIRKTSKRNWSRIKKLLSDFKKSKPASTKYSTIGKWKSSSDISCDNK